MENVKKFYDALANDDALRERANALNEKYKDAKPEEAALTADLIAFAKAEGYSFTAEDLKTYVNSVPQPLDDDELEAVAGGASSDTGGCGCAFGGGGGGKMDNDDTWGCACVIYGQGGDAKNDHCICFCFLAGVGNFYLTTLK
jgi:predicted ribosomally synthesized peptide with nif11-like leader